MHHQHTYMIAHLAVYIHQSKKALITISSCKFSETPNMIMCNQVGINELSGEFVI